MKADVFEKQHAAVGERFALGFGVGADAVRGEIQPACRAALPASWRPGPGEYLGSGPPFGRPSATREPVVAPFLIARRSVGRVSRMRVSSVTTPSFERDVEVYADEDAFAVEVEIVDG